MTKEELLFQISLRETALEKLKESKRLMLKRRFIIRKIFPIVRIARILGDFFYACTLYTLSVFFTKIYIKYMRKAIDSCDDLTAKIKALDNECKLLDALLEDDNET